MSLDDIIAILVPICTDLKARFARGERHFVHPSAIARGHDGLMRLDPALATAPRSAHDRACLAPELVKTHDPGDARAAVFAIGAMLYEAATGTHVGPGMRRPRDVDPKLPPSIEVLLGKALVADAAHRPDDIGALASAMHHLAPMKSIPPPDVDIRNLDQVNGEAVDVRMSLLPPIEVQLSVSPPSSSPASTPHIVIPTGDAPPSAASIAAAAAAPKDPTKQLAYLKARLESDPRPRYVVNKQRMDHGPFNAVELLQQVASHQFTGEDVLRDELTGVSQKIDEWEEFAPFAQHAGMHRDILKEKKEVAKVEAAEKTAGVTKVVAGAVLAVAIVSIGVAFIVKKVGERRDGSALSDDPSALDLSGGGNVKGGKKPRGAGGGRGGAGGGAFVGGMSYEAALASNNQEINIGGAKGGPDLSDAQLSTPMNNASFVSDCGAPKGMKVTVRVAVKMGRAVGVSVSTNPSSPAIAACIDGRVRGLGWPANAKMDSLTTTY